MRLETPELIELLAQRFVLGTQQGAARRRFAAVAKTRPDVRRAIADWEDLLTPLAWAQEPVVPSDLVWQRLCRELGIGRAQPAPPSAVVKPWAALAAAFALVAIIAAGGWWRAATRPPEIETRTVVEHLPETVSVAVVSSADGRPLWLARIAPASREMTVRVVNDVERRPDRDYELWALTDAGIPVSLGILPQTGRATLSLGDESIAALAKSESLAVSLEPPGGSPKATPTGPVLYTAPLLSP